MLVPSLSWGQDEPYVHDSRFPFIILTKANSTKAPILSDAEFYNHSSGVIFKVNRTEIPADDHFMTLYRDSVLPMINERHLQLRNVFVRGAASPEGFYENNRRLGEGRTKALLEELKRDLQFQYMETEVETSSITEDYGYLCRLMRDARDPDFEKVKDMFDACGGDEQCCKNKLMAYNGGALWSRLLRQYFPKLRAARVILWFSEPDEEHAPVVEPVVEPTDTAIVVPPVEEPKVVEPVVVVPEIIEQPQPKVRRHVLAVRTNLLHDFFYMPKYGWAPTPNLQLEFYPWKGHYTFNVGFSCMTLRNWDSHRFYQVRDFQFEVRRYFKGQGRFLGFYLGAVAEATIYGIGLNKEEGWQGEGGAVSISAGYVMPLTKRKNFRLEFMIAAGYFMSRQDPYVYGNPITGEENGWYYYNYLGNATDFKKRNHSFSWFGPTNIGIQLTYDLFYRRHKAVKKRIDSGKILRENCF